MSDARTTLCVACGQPCGNPPTLNALPGGQPCPRCADRVLEAQPSLLPSDPVEQPAVASSAAAEQPVRAFGEPSGEDPDDDGPEGGLSGERHELRLLPRRDESA